MAAFQKYDAYARLAAIEAVAASKAPTTLAALASLADVPAKNQNLKPDIAAEPNIQNEKDGGTTAKVAKTAKVKPLAIEAALAALEQRCPDYVPEDRWHQCIADGRRFLADWGAQANALGWTVPDLFGLHEPPPAKPHTSYCRLSRYDSTGLLWLLQGCPVIALTATTAAIKMPTGNVLTYRRHNKPAFGPLGDSLDDLTV